MKPVQKPSKKSSLNPATVILIRQIVFGVLLLGACALLVLGVWYGTRIPALTISSITANGEGTIPASTVEASAETVLAGTYLGIVPRRFVYLYPAQEILQAVENIERIKSVELSRLNGNRLHINYDEYVPEALWCEAASPEKCWFIDDQGFAFAPAPDLKGGSLLRYFNLAVEPARGGVVATSTDYMMLKDLVVRLTEIGWFVDKVEVDAARDVFYSLVGGGELKVTLHQTIQQTMEALLAIRGSREFSGLAPGNFSYLDLRFGNKVFVNDKVVTAVETDTELTQVATSSAELLDGSEADGITTQ